MAGMQNVTLPDVAGVLAQRATLRFPQPYEAGQPFIEELGTRLMALEQWIRALYAKHGEECPLFKEEEG